MEITACTFCVILIFNVFVFISDVYLYNVLHFILNKIIIIIIIALGYLCGFHGKTIFQMLKS